MDAAQALADLTEISSQIEAAVLFDAKGDVRGSTLSDEEAARTLARQAVELLEGAGAFRGGESAVTQLEAATPQGSVFVVDGGDLRIVATTAPRPTVGLVLYDLKSCLRGAAEEAKPKRRRTTRKKAQEPAADEAQKAAADEA